MNNLKFRVWVKSLNKMFPVDNINFQHNEISISYTDKEKGNMYTQVLNDNHVLMQVTGIKTIDDDDIFDGDIVLVHQLQLLYDETEKEVASKCMIEYDDYVLGFSVVYLEDTPKYEHEKKDSVPICELHGLHEDSFTILGNKYEQPELLK